MLGSPIRTPPDQRSVANSPGLNAGSHVLHRLLMPRHPPCAPHSLPNKHSTKTTNTRLLHVEQNSNHGNKTTKTRKCRQPHIPGEVHETLRDDTHKMLASTIQLSTTTPTNTLTQQPGSSKGGNPPTPTRGHRAEDVIPQSPTVCQNPRPQQMRKTFHSSKLAVLTPTPTVSALHRRFH